MTTAQYKRTSVDIAGLLKVLGENLYSRPEVAVRELIQNASDAISRRRLQTGDQFSPRIDIECHAADNQLIISDNGSGLTDTEIEQFLTRIGTGYTRSLRRDEESSDLIGAFGLGFLTAYMIGNRVEVITTSQTGSAFRFLSENGERYIVSPITPGDVGSVVIISLKDKYEYLSDYGRLLDVVTEYCSLMNIPIHVQGNSEPINKVPPWRIEAENEPQIRKQKRRLEFAEIMEPYFDPVCTIPLDIDDGQGLLWIHDRSTYGGADNRWMQIYVRGMMVAKNKHEFLPGWAGFLSGMLESNSLNPTASREDIIKDATYQSARRQTAQNLISGLTDIAQNQPEVWRSILRRHNEALLGAAIADDALFRAIYKDLTVPTSEGDLGLEDIQSRSPNGLAIALQVDGGADEIVSRAFGTPVILGYRYGAAAMAHKFASIHDLDIIELGTKRGHDVLFPRVETDPATEERLRHLFDEEDQTLILSEFDPPFLSALNFVDAEQSLKAYFEDDEADKKISQGALGLARAFTQKIDKQAPLHLVINLRSPIIKAMLDADTSDAEACAKTVKASAKMLCKHKALGTHGFATAMENLNAGLLAMITAMGARNGG